MEVAATLPELSEWTFNFHGLHKHQTGRTCYFVDGWDVAAE